MGKHHYNISLILSLNHLGFVIFVHFTSNLEQISKIQSEEEKFEEEKERGERRRKGASTSKFVYSLPLSRFFCLLMVLSFFSMN